VVKTVAIVESAQWVAVQCSLRVRRHIDEDIMNKLYVETTRFCFMLLLKSIFLNEFVPRRFSSSRFALLHEEY
jgi:hypothetical protein